MVRRTVLCVSLLLTLTTLVYGQASSILNQYNLQPDVWRPSKPIEPGVDARGDLNLSLPILTVPGRNGLDYPISFSYRSGISVMQQSSWIGLGWSFDPGSISRDVQGVVQGGQAYNVDYANEPVYQPDAYYVTVPGASFTMARHGEGGSSSSPPPRGTLRGFYITEWRPWKIEYQTQNPVRVNSSFGYYGEVKTSVWTTSGKQDRADFSSFTITSDDGTRYVFGLPTISTYEGIHPDPQVMSVEHYVSTWHLIAILGSDYQGPTTPDDAVSTGSWVRLEYAPIFTASRTSTMYASGEKRMMQLTYLSRITTPTHEARFTTTSRPSESLPEYYGDYGVDYRKLSSIQLYDRISGVFVKEIVLDHSLGLHNGDSAQRLSLDAVRFFGQGGQASAQSIPGYRFTYNGRVGGTLIGKNTTDDFGYYNENSLNYSASTNDGTSWSLKSITHPSGGTDLVTYSNDDIFLTANYSTGGYNSLGFNYQTFTEGTGSGYGSYSVTGSTKSQGGTRVTEIKRYENQNLSKLISTTTFEYWNGRLSGIPSAWWEKNQPGTFFKPNSRGQVAVYYDEIRRYVNGEFVESNSYSNDQTVAGLSRIQTLLYRNGGYYTVVQGNQEISWGVPLQTSTWDGKTITRSYSLGPAKLAPCSLLGGEINLVWLVNDRVNSEEILESRTNWDDYGDGTALTTRTDYTYDWNTGRLKSSEVSGETMEKPLRKEFTYGYEVYPELNTLNRLNEVVRTNVGERDASSAIQYTSADITTWSSFNGIWLPYRKYGWKADAASAIAPTVASWAAAQSPGSEWSLQLTNEAYDVHGHVTRQWDARNALTELFYGDNTSNVANTSGLRSAYLTAIRQGNQTWQIDYDSTAGKPSMVTDPTGITTTYRYDVHGRLSSILNGSGQTVRSFEYIFSRDRNGGAYNGSDPNYVGTSLFDGSGGAARVTKSFFDAYGRTIQIQRQLGTKDLITTTEYDAAGRETKLWRPYEYQNPAAHAYDISYTSHAANWYNGTNDGYAYGYPYQENSYSGGLLKAVYAPAISSVRDFSRISFEYDQWLDPTGAALPGKYLAADITRDEEDRPTITLKDGVGRTIITRKINDQAADASTPADLTASVSVSGGTINPIIVQSVDPTTSDSQTTDPKTKDNKKDKNPDGDIVIGPTAVNQTWKYSWTQTFTATSKQLMFYTISMSATRNSAARVDFYENGTLVYSISHNDPRRSGSFIAKPGITYQIRVGAGAAAMTGERASSSCTISYKKDGRVALLIDTRFKLDASGRTLEVMPPNYFRPPSGAPSDWVTSYTYNTLGELLQKKTPDEGIVRYKYNAGGLLRFSQDANQAGASRVTFRRYDTFGRVEKMGEATGIVFSSLSGDGAYPSFEDDTSKWLEVNAYDAKPNTGTFPWSLFATQINAAAMNRLTGRLAATAYRSNGMWQLALYDYDQEGRPATKYSYVENTPAADAVLSFTYNWQGELTQRSSRIGDSYFYQWYTYDQLGRMTDVYASKAASKPATPFASYTYLPSDAVSSASYHGGASLPYFYNSRGWLVRQGDVTSTAYPFSATYVFRKNGEILEADYCNWNVPNYPYPAPTRYKLVFTYDLSGRLLTSTYSPHDGTAFIKSYAFFEKGINYDANGNLRTLQRSDENGVLIDNLTFNYPGNNRLAQITEAVGVTSITWDAEGGSYQYDANGNIIYGPGLPSTSYDVNNLPLMMGLGSVATNYRYSVSGQRTYKKVGSAAAEHYILDDAATVGVFTEGYAPTFNVLAGNVVIGRYSAEDSKYHHYVKDHLGSTRAVVASSGEVPQTYDYYASGLIMPGRSRLEGTLTKEKFTGKERDQESGFDYFGARYYMPALGRWMGVDPLAGAYSSFSPYIYAVNNPLSYVDPNGMDTWAVHGTWSNFELGWCPPSNASCEGEEGDSYAAIWQDFLGDDGELHSFNWGNYNRWAPRGNMNNHRQSRREAAYALAKEIYDAYLSNPEMSINILGHSHGGNVAILAANILYREYGLKTDNLFIFGTPQRDEYRIDPGAASTFMAVYNDRDIVQKWGGDLPLLFTSLAGEIGPAGRIHPYAVNVDASALVAGSMGAVDAHSAMHVSSFIMLKVVMIAKGNGN